MHSNARTGTNIAVNLDRLRRIAVLLAHEPAGFVSANRNESEVGRAKATSHIGKQRLAITCVTDKIEAGVASMQVETTPKTAAATSA